MPDGGESNLTTRATGVPSPVLSMLDAIAVIVGVGIFRTIAVVAAHVSSGSVDRSKQRMMNQGNKPNRNPLLCSSN